MSPNLPRRVAALRLAALGLTSQCGSTWAVQPQGLAPRALQFPQDHGAHPDMQTEWWYLTGRVTSDARVYGFQLSFFRSRVSAAQSLRSNLAAKQLLFGHATITDVTARKLHHDQRAARWNGRSQSGMAWAGLGDTALHLGAWNLTRETHQGSNGRGSSYRTQVQTKAFALELQANSTQALLLQGENGLSSKGPDALHASYYYSQPQLQVRGRLSLNGQTREVTGNGWFDHECSNAVLPPQAVGWDWVGMNLADGSVLTAFQLRNRTGQALWSGGSLRGPTGALRIASNTDVVFSALRFWQSPSNGARYPVEWRLSMFGQTYVVQSLVEAQELDARASTGTVYWEGLSALQDLNKRVLGYGYLEMTGYAAPLTL